jgi:hypothetical protein
LRRRGRRRCNADSARADLADAEPNADTDANPNPNPNPNAYSDAHSHTDADPDPFTHANSLTDTDTDTHAVALQYVGVPRFDLRGRCECDFGLRCWRDRCRRQDRHCR